MMHGMYNKCQLSFNQYEVGNYALHNFRQKHRPPGV